MEGGSGTGGVPPPPPLRSTAVIRLLPVVHADAAAMRAVGADLTPVAGRTPPVRMLREDVDIHLFRTAAVVEATFRLHNDGGALELEVGFPRFGQPGVFKAPDAALMDFAVEVDDTAVATTERHVDNRSFPMW